MKSFSTFQLMELLKLNKKTIYEVSFVKDEFCATHIIYFGGKLLYDTGIDSQEVKWKPIDFLNHYKLTYWKIFQIIPPTYI
ncbi:MAG: hypothetical protein WAR79_03890 [Melioribacteraceae bacterium]